MGYTISKANAILSTDFNKNYYIGLSSTAPNDNGGGFTEPSPNLGYKRAKLTTGSASGKIIQTEEIMYFGEAVKGNWGTMRYFGVFTSETSDTPHYFGKIDVEGGVPVNKGEVGLIRAKHFRVGLDIDSLPPLPDEDDE